MQCEYHADYFTEVSDDEHCHAAVRHIQKQTENMYRQQWNDHCCKGARILKMLSGVPTLLLLRLPRKTAKHL